MLIREFTLDDIPQLSRIRYAIYPWMTASVAAQRNWYIATPPEARSMRIGAEIDGQLVGFAIGGFNIVTKEPNVGVVQVNVDPAFRGRGIGRQLHERLEAHLREIGVVRGQAYAVDEPESIAWAVSRGWTQGAAERFSSVDPRDLPPMPATPSGVEVVSISELEPKALYDLDIVAGADEPGDVAYDGMPFDLWLKRVWNGPDMRHDASTVAVVDGVPASVTYVEANLETGRSWSAGTATLREYRGRGLAKLIKSVALRKTAELGVTDAVTANDRTNGPMLAINNWLGYQEIASERSMLKKF